MTECARACAPNVAARACARARPRVRVPALARACVACARHRTCLCACRCARGARSLALYHNPAVACTIPLGSAHCWPWPCPCTGPGGQDHDPASAATLQSRWQQPPLPCHDERMPPFTTPVCHLSHAWLKSHCPCTGMAFLCDDASRPMVIPWPGNVPLNCWQLELMQSRAILLHTGLAKIAFSKRRCVCVPVNHNAVACGNCVSMDATHWLPTPKRVCAASVLEPRTPCVPVMPGVLPNAF